MSKHRDITRKERYRARLNTARKFPISMATVNFIQDQNVGFLTRAVACFGGKDIHVIGRIPEYKILRAYSGSLNTYVNYIQHKNPIDFLNYVRANNIYLLSAELADNAINLNHYKFPMDREIICVLGNEETGVPVEILHNSDAIVQIPNRGVGYCINTSQTGNVLLFEYQRQMALDSQSHTC